MADDFIRRSYAEAVISQRTRQMDIWRGVMAIPAADAVEVVRCKDCKYHEPFIICGEPIGMMVCRKLHQKETPDDWFCADGERREGNNED